MFKANENLIKIRGIIFYEGHTIPTKVNFKMIVFIFRFKDQTACTENFTKRKLQPAERNIIVNILLSQNDVY